MPLSDLTAFLEHKVGVGGDTGLTLYAVLESLIIACLPGIMEEVVLRYMEKRLGEACHEPLEELLQVYAVCDVLSKGYVKELMDAKKNVFVWEMRLEMGGVL